MARDHGIKLIPHGWNTAIGLAADLQLASAFADTDLVEYIAGSPYIDDLRSGGWSLDEDGMLDIPDIAGPRPGARHRFPATVRGDAAATRSRGAAARGSWGVTLDVLIAGGWLIDGTGNPAFRGDVAIEGDRIVDIGRLEGAEAARVIDAEGLVVTPGLIDAHSHSDWTVLSNPTAESAIRQGVTSEIVGNCGIGLAPVSPASRAVTDTLLHSYAYDGDATWRSYGEYLDVIAGLGTSINYAWLVGGSTIRAAAGATAGSAVRAAAADDGGPRRRGDGRRRARDVDRSGTRRRQVRQPPRSRGSRPWSSGTAGCTSSHIRNRDAGLQVAMDEFMGYAAAAGGRAQVSHLNVRANTGAEDGAWERAVATIEAARRDGIDVLTDTISMTWGIGLMAGILPPWVLHDGLETGLARLDDPEIRRRLRTECDRYWRFIHRGEWQRVRLVASPQFPELNGLTFPEIAAIRGRDEWDCFFDLLVAAGPDAPRMFMYGELYTEAHLQAMVGHPLFMLAVDAMNSTTASPLAERTYQPLVYSGQIYHLTHHVLETGLLRLEEAIRKMTSMPANHFGLRGRGLLQPGFMADVVVMDVGALKAKGTLAAPVAYAEGIEHVLVNGTSVLDGNTHTGSRPGRNLLRA